MTVDTSHNPEDRDELIQLYLDGQLSAERRAEVERLLDTDPQARRIAKALSSVKRAVKTSACAAPLPAATREAVETLLDREIHRRSRRRLPWILATAAAILILIFLSWPRPGDQGPLPSLIASDFRQYVAGRLPLPIETGNAAELERRFEESLPHLTRVFDLSAMDIELLGGRIHSVGGRPAALFVYRDASGQVYICEMTPGHLSELPDHELKEELENDGIAFRVYQRRPDLTLVYWQEGGTVCVLISNAPRDQVVALAFAKAAKAQQKACRQELQERA